MGSHDGVPEQAPLSIRPAAGLIIVGLGASLAPLDIAVNVALPAITSHFRLALNDVQWLVICYVLVYGSLMLVCGKLGDLFGYRLIFRIGLAVSAVGCAACAMAPDWPLFLWARAGQGVGTALALSCTPALATSVYPADQRLRWLLGPDADLTDEALLAEALTLLRAHDAMAEARADVLSYANNARTEIMALPDVPARAAFLALCDFVVKRTG